MTTIISPKYAAPLAIISLILAVIFPFLGLATYQALLLVLIIYTFTIAFISPQLGLFLLLLVRPCMDILTDEKIFSIGYFNLNFSALIAILTIIFSGRVIIFHWTKLKQIPLLKPWLFFLLACLVSGFVSINYKLSIAEWLRLFSIFCLYIVSYVTIVSKTDLIKLIRVIILSSIIPGAFAVWQYITDTGLTVPFEGIYNRISGTFAHPNLFAYYIVIPLSLALFIFLSGDKKKINTMPYLLLAASLSGLLALTFTRGAWLAFLIVVMIIGLARFRFFLFGVTCLLLMSYYLIDPINTRVNDITRYNPDSSISWRIGLWKDSAKIAIEKPILGHGTGVANKIIGDQRGARAGSSDPHNDYLKIALENGAIGLLAYGLLILNLLKYLIDTYRTSKLPKLKVLFLTILSITLALYFMSLGDNILRNTALQWTFWALIGAVMAQQNNKKIKN